MSIIRRVVTAAGTATLMVLGTAGAAAAMSGGTPVTDHTAAPWVATLAMTGDAPLLQRAGCGGALIASDRVLTAAHCVDGTDPSRTEVHVGAHVLSSEPGQVRRIRGVSTLPGYRILPSPVDPGRPDLSSARNDLAVILLDSPVTDVMPLRIASHRPAAGSAVTFFAHGTTGIAGQDSYRNDVLHRGDLTVSDARACHDATPATVDDASVVCATDTTSRDADTVTPPVTGCYQDSGSPLVQTINGVTRLVGMFSFGGETAGKSCGQASPLYFADPTAFRAWAHLPILPTQPYPQDTPQVTVAGDTARCAAPGWDLSRGLPPSRITFQWATVTVYGPFVVPAPIDGATSRTLRLDPDHAATPVACLVTAANLGGVTTTMSDPVTGG
ncbi:S1 family peptidase [Actinoplanes sp. NPDC020271]|uniref:S1 family peptidase n=1 Tax=Actinoplanes sp. NPDC020271 TaxID=3363896 RepID=UPI0037A37868